MESTATTIELRTCRVCCVDLPLDAFGICNRRRDKLNTYCKACTREKMRVSRHNLRAIKGFVKPQVSDLPIRERVLRAIRLGHATREALEKATRLGEDSISDVLAELWDEGVIELDRGTKRFWRVRECHNLKLVESNSDRNPSGFSVFLQRSALLVAVGHNQAQAT